MKIKKFLAPVITVFLLSGSIVAFAEPAPGQTIADITFLSGTLDMLEISNLSFGARTIESTGQNYTAQQASVFLDIRDLRGTGEGWELTALVSEFTHEESTATSDSLPGSSISFINGTASSTHPTSNAPDVSPSIILDCDSGASADVAEAQVNEGLGVWSIQWNGVEGNNAKVFLHVLGGVATVGTHSATITWSLTSGP